MAQAALDAAAIELKRLLGEAGVKLASPKLYDAIAKAVVKTHNNKAAAIARTHRKLTASTRILNSLEVGEVATFPHMSKQAMQNRIKVARNTGVNFDLAFSIWHEGLTTKVRRLPDGIRPPSRDQSRNSPKAHFMASIQPGESKLAPVDIFPLGRCQLTSYAATARKLCNDPDAKWRQRTTSKGVRIYRD